MLNLHLQPLLAVIDIRLFSMDPKTYRSIRGQNLANNKKVIVVTSNLNTFGDIQASLNEVCTFLYFINF